MSAAQILTFDKTPLSAPVPAAEAAAEASQRFRDEGGKRSEGGVTAGAVVRVIVMILALWALAVVFVRVIQMLGGAPAVGVSTIVIGALMVLPIAIDRVRNVGGGLREMRARWYRLRRFAAANGLTHVTTRSELPEGPELFVAGEGGWVSDVVSGGAPRGFEAADFAWETYVASGRLVHEATYIGFDTFSTLPPVALTATATTGGVSSWAPKKGQRDLQIDGDLGAHFTVHCAPTDDDAVRRMLTGAASARLVDLAAEVDVEVADGRVFFIPRRAIALDEPAFWEWVEDLSRMLDADLDPRPELARVPIPADDPARVERRRRLFRRTGAGRRIMIGCLLPLVVGIVLAVLTASWG